MNFFKAQKNKITSSELHVTYMSLVYFEDGCEFRMAGRVCWFTGG